jgi:hypothetical protein
MKKIFLILLVVTVFACKDESKKVKESNQTTEKKGELAKTQENVLSESKIPEYSKWVNKGIQITESHESYNGEDAILMSRENGANASYLGISNLKVVYGSTYKTSVVVKKGEIGKDFALRIQGVYPNRIDAIFDLETGKAKEPKISGSDELAENAKATIESLGDGWYKCSLYADIYADYVRVVLGPTKANLNTSLWETRTGEKSSVYLVLSMLKLQEL